jgi:hypothetical protein
MQTGIEKLAPSLRQKLQQRQRQMLGCLYSANLLLFIACALAAWWPAPPPTEGCPHHGCCLHDTLRMQPEGPCTPNCLLRANRCHINNPGSEGGTRI